MRIEGDITETTCSEEIESFAKHGQLVPVLGRPLRGDPDYDIELIYGARRLFVARHLNKALLVEVRSVPDREAIVAMEIENRQRVDVSPYERGLSFARWLRTGIFRTQEDLARSLKISGAMVSRLLAVARLPSAVLCAFERPADIRETWGLAVMEALGDPQRRQDTLGEARRIGSAVPRPAAPEIYRRLRMAAVRGHRVRRTAHDEVVNDSAGVPLFRIRQQTGSIALLLAVEDVSAQTLGRIRAAVLEILQAEKSQVVESSAVTRFSRRAGGEGRARAGYGVEP